MIKKDIFKSTLKISLHCIIESEIYLITNTIYGKILRNHQIIALSDHFKTFEAQ